MMGADCVCLIVRSLTFYLAVMPAFTNVPSQTHLHTLVQKSCCNKCLLSPDLLLHPFPLSGAGRSRLFCLLPAQTVLSKTAQ